MGYDLQLSMTYLHCGDYPIMLKKIKQDFIAKINLEKNVLL